MSNHTDNEVAVHDTLIVGAGPIGLELAVCLKHLGCDYAHVEAGQVGQTISWYPREADFFSSAERIAIAGVPIPTASPRGKVRREDYLRYLHAIVRQFDLTVNAYERVVSVEAHPKDGGNSGRQSGHHPGAGVPSLPAGTRFLVTTDRRGRARRYAVRHVVLAIGDMHRPRWLGIPGEAMPHVSHYFQEPHGYFRQNLLIVGGKNSAVEAALRCYHAGANVTLSYRRDAFNPDAIKYWLLPEINALIQHGKIAFHPNTVPIHIDAERVTLAPAEHAGAATEADHTSRPRPQPQPSEARDVPADFVLLMTGYEMDHTLFDTLNLQRESGENRAPKLDPSTQAPSVPGVYVAGTAAAGTQHKFKLYIENTHPHVARIAQAITGQAPPMHLINTAVETFGLPES